MALTITHSTPADGTFSATGATAWNANHSFTVSGTTGELQYNNAGDLAGMSGTSWNDTTRSLTLTGATVTASSPVLDLSQTWNNAAVTFTGLKFNATDTASAAGALLMQLQAGGTDVFQVRKNGSVYLPNNGAIGQITNNVFNIAFGGDGRIALNSAGNNGVSINSDVIIRRRAAANFQLGAQDAAAPVAQTLSVQSVVAGTTNTAGANFTITASQGTGSANGGSIVFQLAPAGSSGTAQNALVDAAVIFASGASRFIGTSGNVSTTGSYFQNNGTLRLNDGGANGSFAPTLWKWPSTASVGWVSTTDGNGQSLDLILARDAADTLAQRRGTNAQAFRVYNTFTDASNYERGKIEWASNVLRIGTEKAGTGTARALELQTDGTSRWSIGATTGHLLASADNTYDIGASGANRPRNVFAAGHIAVPEIRGGASRNSSLVIGGNWVDFVNASGGYNFRITPSASTKGIVQFSDDSGDFNRLQFGGTTSSFPALKRSSTSIIVRLADDSANAPLESASVKTDAPTGGTSGTWKLGVRVAATTLLDTTQYIEVDIGGTLYKVALVTT